MNNNSRKLINSTVDKLEELKEELQNIYYKRAKEQLVRGGY